MKREHLTWIVVWVCAISVFAPGVAYSSFYDDFSDGWYERDPNDPQHGDPNYHTYDYGLWQFDPNDANDYASAYWTDANNAVFWDQDNPDWAIFIMAANPQAHIITDTVADKALRLVGHELGFPAGMGTMAAGVASGADGGLPDDPTWFDDSCDHYVLAWIYYTGYYHPTHPDPNRRFSFNDPSYDPNYDDPNEDHGRAYLVIHAEGLAGLLIGCDFDCNIEDPGTQNLQFQAFSGDIDPAKAGATFRRIWIDPNDPDWAQYPNQPYGCPTMKPDDPVLNPYNGPNFGGENLDNWERSGFWMLFQFENDGSAPTGDPNGKWARGAIWHGDKYDWDGKYILEGQYSDPAPGVWNWDAWGGGDYWYRAEGYCFLMTNSANDWAGGFPCETAFDNVEARWGRFADGVRQIALDVKNSGKGSVLIDPELCDPNDPNDPAERLLRYTDGTEVVLVAIPTEGDSFKHWTIYDPNFPGDSNHVTIEMNPVLLLTMDGDYEIEAAFKCGSGVEQAFPLLVMGLFVCAISFGARRFRGR